MTPRLNLWAISAGVRPAISEKRKENPNDHGIPRSVLRISSRCKVSQRQLS